MCIMVGMHGGGGKCGNGVSFRILVVGEVVELDILVVSL